MESAFVVAQMGARMHYAVPRLFHEHNLLSDFYTDICAVKGWPRLVSLLPDWALPTDVRRLKARVPTGLPVSKIQAFTGFGLEYQQRRTRARSISEMTATHLWAGETFCNLILQANPAPGAGLYCFNSAGLEVLKHWRQHKQLAILEQTIAPRRIEDRIVQAEEQAFPNWQESLPQDDVVQAYMIREEAEWQHADVILCGSEFVKAGIAQCGGPVKRCIVVPYGVPIREFHSPAKPALKGRPLRVLTAGEVCLRKGSHYVLQAAQRMTGRAEFRMLGPMGFVPGRLDEFNKYISYQGVIPRTDIANHFAWADVFLFPSLCEGSATVTYEALSAGLPVIATQNSGSILQDGVSGCVIPERDVDAIVGALEEFLMKPELLLEMSSAARERSTQGSMEAYAQRLLELTASAERLHQGSVNANCHSD